MTYDWLEYQKAKKIVTTFEQERSLIQQKRYNRKIIFTGYVDTKEQHIKMLKVRIWLKREYLANEIKNINWTMWDDETKKTYLDELRNELYKLRYEYFKFKTHGITRFD